MRWISDLLSSGSPTLSFELFPPRTPEAGAELDATLDQLDTARPAFYSVTCGAGGAGQHGTRELVLDMAARRGATTMAHLTGVGLRHADAQALLNEYAAGGVVNVLALAGDPPADGTDPKGDFHFASELVELIRGRGGFAVGVAAHPEVHPRSPDRASDRRHLAVKLALADFAVTQFFFDPDDYFRLVDELDLLGVAKPVLPGVFPVTVPRTVKRFADMNGAKTPDELFAKLDAADAGDRLAMAIDHAAELAERLLSGGAPGVHLYTMNRPEAALGVVRELNRWPV